MAPDRSDPAGRGAYRVHRLSLYPLLCDPVVSVHRHVLRQQQIHQRRQRLAQPVHRRPERLQEPGQQLHRHPPLPHHAQRGHRKDRRALQLRPASQDDLRRQRGRHGDLPDQSDGPGRGGDGADRQLHRPGAAGDCGLHHRRDQRAHGGLRGGAHQSLFPQLYAQRGHRVSDRRRPGCCRRGHPLPDGRHHPHGGLSDREL